MQRGGPRLRDVLLPRLADVTEATLPQVLAGTLMEHELFCELVSQLTTHLEHNVSYCGWRSGSRSP